MEIAMRSRTVGGGGQDYVCRVALSDSRHRSLERATDATTVRHLVEAVGAPVLRVLAAPRGLEQRVRGTVLHDPVDSLPHQVDAVLLMAGLRVDDVRAAELVRIAAERGYCTVVVKRRGGDLSALVTEASMLGVTVLAADDDVSWRHLDALLLSVLGARGLAAESPSGFGDELFALADAIAAVVGGSVAIEDMERRVLAYSSMANQRIDALREQGILDRHVPDMERNRIQYRTVLASTGVVRFPDVVDELARAAIAIRAGTRPLGTIWAIERAGGIEMVGERALLDGARLAALHMLRSLNASEVEMHARESALREALDGALTPAEVRFRLSLPDGADLALVGFAALPAAPDESAPLVPHIAGALARHLAAYRPDAALVTTSRTIYVLLSGTVSCGARRFATGALTALRVSFANQVRAAISFPCADPAELPNMRREIDDILRVSTVQLDLPPVAELADAHTRVLLAQVADELVRRPRLRHPGVVAMAAHDAEHQTAYTASVTAWLDAVGDVTAAARELEIHPNTLRYRLRRAGELFDISLDRPEDRLSVWMQLRLTSG